MYYAYTFDPSGSVVQKHSNTSSTYAIYTTLYDTFGVQLGSMDPGTSSETVASKGDAVGFGGQWGYYTDNEVDPYIGAAPQLRHPFTLNGARYYDPSVGRFLTRDPIGYEGGINLYTFCGNNPINYADPSGMDSFLDNIADIASFIPGAGEVIDAGHAISHLARGNYAEAASYGLSAIPIAHEIGDIVKGGRFAVKVIGKYNKVRALVKDSKLVGQVHHLLQRAAFRKVISKAEGVSVNLIGDVFKDLGSEHRRAHQVLESFWDLYREGGDLNGVTPTIGQYLGSVKSSLKEAGLTRNEIGDALHATHRQLREYGLKLNDLIPEIPGRIHMGR